MPTNEYKTVNVSQIVNYKENPRHDVASNQTDTIKRLINKVGSQYMYNLASDIYRNGLLGANLPVLVYSADIKKYIAYEGNRRIACIKFLCDPNILTTIDKSLKQRIEKLKNTEEPVFSTDIFCLITNEKEAFKIMEKIHSGEDKGRGTKAWTSKEKAIFKSRIKDKKTIELVIADLFEKHFKEDVTTKISYTTIQRFFNNREVKKAIDINSDLTNIDEKKIILIRYLIDQAIAESLKKNVTLTRLFNKAREIEDFLIPLIERYKANSGIINDLNDAEDSNPATPTPSSENPMDSVKTDSGVSENNKGKESVKFYLNPNLDNTYSTDQTINLFERLVITNEQFFIPELLEINCSGLNMIQGIVQPNNLPGDYEVTYKYYLDASKIDVYWQEGIKLSLKTKKKSFTTSKQLSVLSTKFVNKYFEKLQFEHADKLKSLMIFLSNESKNGRYSNLINIVSRMFLEYSFRMYASKVLKENNDTIDNNSKSLQSFIDGYCNRIERENPEKFIKHIQRGRKDATSKIDILQKSIHYFDVSISNEDIQNIFINLNVYLEYIYDKLIDEN